jgi:hypothetical protein
MKEYISPEAEFLTSKGVRDGHLLGDVYSAGETLCAEYTGPGCLNPEI